MGAVTPELACKAFAAIGPASSVASLPGGHIHETWLVEGASRRFVLQRCNVEVFPDLDAVMANMAIVCDTVYPGLRAVPALDGGCLWHDAEDGVWRAFPYIEHSVRPAPVPSPAEVRELGRGLGELHRRMAALDWRQLVETLPGFHDPPARLAVLDELRGSDPNARRSGAEAALVEVDRLRHIAHMADRLQAPAVPLRVAHFDAKTDNFLLDADTGRVVAIIDLDTVMPGSVLWDVGDLARSALAGAPEDEPEPHRVNFDVQGFANLIAGYRSEADAFLTPSEIEAIAVAPLVVTYEQAVRFLSDYLAGDVYYRVADPAHNLRRCRAQLALVESMWTQRSAMICT